MILLDTSVISALMQTRPDSAVVSWLDGQGIQEVWLPSLVVFELRFGVAALPAGQRRRSLQQGLDQLLEQLVQDRIAPLDGLAAHRAADLAAERKARGRQVDLRDTLIAGIALARGAQLATRNTRHFSDTSISLINPFAP
ncbi:MAG: type II toxin-antitoxin system VapC family toxin [Prochlorococcaceae cyanobacterium]